MTSTEGSDTPTAAAEEPRVNPASRGRKRKVPRRGPLWQYGPSVIVAFAGIVLSLVASLVVGRQAMERRAFNFERIAEARCSLFQNEIHYHIHELEALGRFYAGSEYVTRGEFKTFTTPFLTHHLCIRAFVWAPRVPVADRRTFEKAVRAEGTADYRILDNSPDGDMRTAAERDEYYPVLYRNPRLEPVMGWDLTGSPYRNDAIGRARDTGRTAATRQVVFPCEQEERKGVIICLPVYRKGASIGTVEERRCAIEGVLACVLYVGGMLERVIERLGPAGTNIVISDLSAPAGERFIYFHRARLQHGEQDPVPPKEGGPSGLECTYEIDVAGRQWLLTCTPSSGYLAVFRLWGRWAVLSGGLFLSVLLSLWLRVLRRRTEVVEELVVERTKALRESEENFRDLADNSPDGVIIAEAQGRIIYANRRMAGITGYSVEELVGLNGFGRITRPEDAAEYRKIMERMMGGEPHPGEYERIIVRKDGSEVITLFNTTTTRWKGKTSPMVTIRDITERKRAEQERIRLLSAIGQAAEAIVITDEGGTIQYVNPAFERVTGYTREEAVGETLRILMSGEHADVLYSEMWDGLVRGEVWKGTLKNRRKDGTLFIEKASISPVFDGAGNIINYVAVKHDITRERSLEEQLVQAQKMEAIGRLAGGIAHDFNNMLVVIIGYSGMALSRLNPGDPLYSYLQEINRASEHSVNITRQLLAFSRRQTIEPRIIDLNDAVANMGKMLSRLLGEEIDYLFVSGEDLWRVKLDPGQLDQVIMNLIVNARDAMPGHGKLTIETANVTIDDAYCSGHPGFIAGQFAMLAVSDTGAGMDVETREHIFEPFYSKKVGGEGTGLGLSTVYGAVKQNEGFINVYSEPGKGTTFKIYMPRVMGKAEKIVRPAEGVPRSGTETILLVEDNAMVRTITGLMLEKCGYTVLETETPGDAILLYEKYQGDIHLLFTDVVMPMMDGRELRDRLDAIKPGIRVLFMSGYTSNVISHRGVLDEGTSFIQKPFTIESLARKVREVLDE